MVGGSLRAASDKVYQLLAHGRWFSPDTPASFTTEIDRHDLAEILLKVALNTKNQIIIRYDHSQKIENPFNLNIFGAGTLKGLNREGLCVTDASFSYLVSLKHELVDSQQCCDLTDAVYNALHLVDVLTGLHFFF